MTGMEKGSKREQGFGKLAEIVIRKTLGINQANNSLGHDIVLSSGVKLDIKCRGGRFPFQQTYVGRDGIARDAKHNFFARQIWDNEFDADAYVMTHLQTPDPADLPGTARQRKWKLYVGGWVSKIRVKNEAVFLPLGSLTEQGQTWFTYRANEIEFYHKNLNGLNQLVDLLQIDQSDILADARKQKNLHLTVSDATRIGLDLVGRQIINPHVLEKLKNKLAITKIANPILHPNQYHHLLEYMKENGLLEGDELSKLSSIMPKESYVKD
jgi:hypothetical protein